jgi:hypothetical protein
MSALVPSRNNYVVVGATSSTVFAAAGAYIHRVLVNVASNTEATATVKDGATTLVAFPATTPIGVYSVELNVATKGAITAACSQNASMSVIGSFSDYV